MYSKTIWFLPDMFSKILKKILCRTVSSKIYSVPDNVWQNIKKILYRTCLVKILSARQCLGMILYVGHSPTKINDDTLCRTLSHKN